MAIVVKIFVKNFNPDKLQEELVAAGAGSLIVGIGWAGFFQANPRLYSPNAGVVEAGRTVSNGVVTVDNAQPGELRFTTTRVLTGPEDNGLNNVLTNHNATILSQEQIRQNQDEADLDALIATERAAFIANLNGWDAMSTANKLIAAKAMFTTIAKIMRFILRQERGIEI